MRSQQNGRHILFFLVSSAVPCMYEREAEASPPRHRGFWARLMVRLDWPTARTHRQATRSAGDQAITSPGRCALNLSLRAQTDPNDPDLRDEADRYGRPGPSPCSEAGLAFRGPFRPHWPRGLRLADIVLLASTGEFPISNFVMDGIVD